MALIYTYGYEESGMAGLLNMVFVRVLLVGWQHPFYTAFIGIGLATARLIRICLDQDGGSAGGLGASSVHARATTHWRLIDRGVGYVVGSMMDWAGWCLMLLFGHVYDRAKSGNWSRRYLYEEVTIGNISQKQYTTACSAWSQDGRPFFGAGLEPLRQTARFYQLCGELAHKRNQINSLGEESGNSRAIAYLRTNLTSLSPALQLIRFAKTARVW